MDMLRHGLKLICCLLALSGCHRRGPNPSSLESRGLKVGKIEVRIESGALEEERLDVFNRISGTRQIEEQVLEKLKARNLYDASGPVSLRLSVNSFRLRHGATRFFTGFQSGSDNVGARVQLFQKQALLLDTRAEVSGGNGNMFNISRESRGKALFDGLSKRIVVLLTQESLR